MKALTKSCFLFALLASTFAQAETCTLGPKRALYLGNVMAEIDHFYLCTPSGPSKETQIETDLSTCIVTGVSSKDFGGGPAAVVYSKNGISKLSDAVKMGRVFSFHANGFQGESVSISQKELHVETKPGHLSQIKIHVNLENGSGNLVSQIDAANIQVNVPMQCRQLP